jgi:hypothetical protein
VVLRESYQNAGAYGQYTQLSRDLEGWESWRARGCETKRTRRRSVRLTEEALGKATYAYQAGRTLRDLAQDFEINRERLALLLRSCGTELRPRGPNCAIQPRDEKGRYLDRSH